MVKRRRGRKRRAKLVAIPFVARLPLSTLGASTVVTISALPSDFGEDFYCHSVFATWALREGTATEGPLSFGYAHGDLSVTEILEAITAEVTDPDDIIAKERSRRPVRKTGSFPGLSTNEIWNDGRQGRTGLGFSVGDGHTLDCWILNNSASALAGGTIVEIDGVIYGRWQR